MDPFTVAIVGGAVLGTYGQLKSGSDAEKAARANAEYYKQQAEYNAIIAKREEDNFKADLEKIQAATVVGAAASGIDLSGSVLSVMADNMIAGQQEIEDIRLRGKMQVEQSNFAKDRSIAEGKSERFKSYIGAGQSILGGYTDYKGAQAKGLI